MARHEFIYYLIIFEVYFCHFSQPFWKLLFCLLYHRQRYFHFFFFCCKNFLLYCFAVFTLYINADCPYETWRNVVWAVLSTGWKRAEAIAQAWSSSAPDRYNDDAFWLVANSYMPNHSNPISLGTVYHHARTGGWNG
jgi:hypothetical protein